MTKRYQSRYVEGETAEATFILASSPTSTYVEVVSASGKQSYPVDVSGSSAAVSIPTVGLAGRVRWYLFATYEDGTAKVEERGEFTVAPLVSSHRATAEKIKRAIDAWNANPFATHSFGEISVSYKNIADLRAQYAAELAAADAEESGVDPETGCVPLSFEAL